MTASGIIWLVFGAATYTVGIALLFLKLGIGIGRHFERDSFERDNTIINNGEENDYENF